MDLLAKKVLEQGFFLSPRGETIKLMYKLEFITTNNTAEYEALLLGLKNAKYLSI